MLRVNRFSLNQSAKHLGMKRIDLINLLFDRGWLYRDDGNQFLPTPEAIQLQIAEIRPTHYCRGRFEVEGASTKITGRGLARLLEDTRKCSSKQYHDLKLTTRTLDNRSVGTTEQGAGVLTTDSVDLGRRWNTPTEVQKAWNYTENLML